MADTNLAQDKLKDFVRRIESLEDEIVALNADKSEVYKEAKSSGFDTKQLRKVIQKRRLPADEREEQDTVFDLYWDAVHASEKSSAHARVENIEEFPAKTTVATLRSNPALAIVEAANIAPKSDLSNKQNDLTKNQPTKAAGSDLVVHSSPSNDQVAPNPEAKASTDGGTTEQDIETPADGVTADASRASVGAGLDAEIQESHRAETPEGQGQSALCDNADVAGKSVEASASAAPASLYAAPGVVVWESTPPEGVERHPYSTAFGTLGQDIVVIADDIAGAKAAPIVKIGNSILDGWARYMTARGAIGLDGHSTEYQVVQYDGSDPLMDCIRWNMAGRIMTDREKQLVVQRLSVLAPERKREIIKAVAELAV
ncbi:DUF2312 domain-containing protein [Devosia soli]|uniref:DUF2312 domain-containing protein n=1 Tax=Devosia soli TaxID=361041 RepID=UPI000A00E8D6|nr:DUF2312 domain-containing protein [Devosia soli]